MGEMMSITENLDADSTSLPSGGKSGGRSTWILV